VDDIAADVLLQVYSRTAAASAYMNNARRGGQVGPGALPTTWLAHLTGRRPFHLRILRARTRTLPLRRLPILLCASPLISPYHLMDVMPYDNKRHFLPGHGRRFKRTRHSTVTSRTSPTKRGLNICGATDSKGKAGGTGHGER